MKKFSPIYILAAATVLLFLCSLIPLLYASFYIHPLHDDFSFSASAHHAILNGAGLSGAVAAAIKKAADAYMSWQGTFSAIFVFAMQPAIFSDKLYFLTTFIMAFALSFSTYFFLDTVIVKWIGSKRVYGIIISSLVLFCSFQFVLSVPEMLYWYNGASYYTLFYSISLCFFSLLIRLYLQPQRVKRTLMLMLEIFIAVFIGGGNYTTALFTSCLFALALLSLTLKKADRLYQYYIIFIALILSFAISIIAPGNAVRGALFEGYGPLKAVLKSLTEAAGLIKLWTALPQIAVFAFLSPLLYAISGKANWGFRYPLPVCVLAFLCFATQLTPPLYALRTLGAYRQMNIYYFAYYLYMLFNIFYICGWLRKKGLLRIKPDSLLKPIPVISAIVACVLVFCVGCRQYGVNNMSSVMVADALYSGTAWQYELEYMDIVEKLRNGEEDVNDISTVPEFVFLHFSYSEPGLPLEDGVKRVIANYYGF